MNNLRKLLRALQSLGFSGVEEFSQDEFLKYYAGLSADEKFTVDQISDALTIGANALDVPVYAPVANKPELSIFGGRVFKRFDDGQRLFRGVDLGSGCHVILAGSNAGKTTFLGDLQRVDFGEPVATAVHDTISFINSFAALKDPVVAIDSLKAVMLYSSRAAAMKGGITVSLLQWVSILTSLALRSNRAVYVTVPADAITGIRAALLQPMLASATSLIVLSDDRKSAAISTRSQAHGQSGRDFVVYSVPQSGNLIRQSESAAPLLESYRRGEAVAIEARDMSFAEVPYLETGAAGSPDDAAVMTGDSDGSLDVLTQIYGGVVLSDPAVPADQE